MNFVFGTRKKKKEFEYISRDKRESRKEEEEEKRRDKLVGERERERGMCGAVNGCCGLPHK